MQRLIQYLINYYLANNIVSKEDLPWLRYGLEKRISSVIVAVPFFVLALFMTNFPTATTFFISFYSIRRYTNGYHAKTIGSCFIQSLLYEILFLGIVGNLLNLASSVILSTISFVIILILSPFNHPNMHLSSQELKACRIRSQINSGCIWGCNIFSALIQNGSWLKGFSSGIVMAAYLLCLAYLLNGGNQNEQTTRKDQTCGQ